MLKTVSSFVFLGTIGLMNFTCAPSTPNPLDQLGTVDLSIKDHPFRLWVADSPTEQERGLMFVTRSQMADLPDGTRRGMIFVFPYESERSFWMKNTIIPLDIAYLDAKGTVVSTYTMVALDDRHGVYPSNGAAKYAIEVNENVYTEIGLSPGDTVTVPTEKLPANH